MKKIFILSCILIFSISTAYSEEPLNLEQCLDMALKNNNTILNAQAQMMDSKLLKNVARSNFMPSVNAGVGYGHSENGPSSQKRIIGGVPVPAQPRSTSSQYSSNVSLNQTIWDGGYSIANFKKSGLTSKAAELNFEDTRQTIIYNVEGAYLELLKQKHLLEVYRETIKSSEEALKKAQSMETIGAAPHSDVLKARVKYENDKMNLIMAENNLEVARANLNYLIGFDVNRQTEVQEVALSPTLEMEYDDAVKLALENHPSLKRSELQVQAAKNDIKMAKSAYLPQFSGSAYYSWGNQNFGNISNMFDEDFYWSASLSLGISLFDGFARPANVSRAKIGYKNLQDYNVQTKRLVTLEVKTAYLLMNQSEKQIAVAMESVKSAEEDLKQSSARYQLGAGTMLEQIDSQVALTSVKADKIQAEYNYRLAESRLKKAMGKLKK